MLRIDFDWSKAVVSDDTYGAVWQVKGTIVHSKDRERDKSFEIQICVYPKVPRKEEIYILVVTAKSPATDSEIDLMLSWNVTVTRDLNHERCYLSDQQSWKDQLDFSFIRYFRPMQFQKTKMTCLGGSWSSQSSIWNIKSARTIREWILADFCHPLS